MKFGAVCLGLLGLVIVEAATPKGHKVSLGVTKRWQHEATSNQSAQVAHLVKEGEQLSQLLEKAAVSLNMSAPTRHLLQSFRICGQCKEFKRLGERHDGGYLTCMDHLHDGHVKAAYSMGVEHHDQWSEDIAALMKIPVNQYDCTVGHAPAGCPTCHFFQKCLQSADGKEVTFPGRSWTLEQAIQESGMKDAPDRSLIMKMDIEAAEWPILAAETKQRHNLQKFQEIILEFHWLRYTYKHQQYLNAMTNMLDAGFSVVHIHGNNYAGNVNLEGYSIPDVIEVTFEAGAPPRQPRQCSSDQEYLPQDSRNNLRGPELPMASLPRM